MVKRPFLILGIASFFASLVCTHLPLLWCVYAAIAATAAFVLCAVFRRVRVAGAGMLVCAAVLLMALGVAAKEWLVVQPTLSLAGRNAYVAMRVEEEVADGKARLATVESGDIPKGTAVCLWLPDTLSPAAGELVYGEVWLTAACEDTRSERALSVKAMGTYLYAWASGEDTLFATGDRGGLPWWRSALYDMRAWIRSTLNAALPADEAALCESMVIGERASLSATTETAYRRAGVYHLLVVSGLHLTLIAGFLLRGLKLLRVPRTVRVLLTMGGVVLFTALCGFSTSVIRAALMMLLALLAMLLHRRTDGLNTIGMAAFFMLLADPFCVLDIGWQLSFAATLGILGLLPVWEREVNDRLTARMPRLGRWLHPVLTALGASLTATLMTQPLITLYFGELSLVFLPVNLIAVPLASAIVVLCMLGLLLSWKASVAQVLFWGTGALCRMLDGYVMLWASVPSASLRDVPPHAVWWLFALLAVVVVAYRVAAMRGVRRATAVMLAVLCVGSTLYGTLMYDVSTVVTAPSSAPWVLLKTPEGHGLILTSGADAAKTAEQLYDEGVDALSWVLYIPAEQAAGTTLSVPVDHLVLTADADRYAGFPAAARTSRLQSGEHLRIGKGDAVARVGDSYRVTLGETALLLGSSETEVDALPVSWQKNDILLLDGGIPYELSRLQAEQVVVFGSFSESEAIKDRLPHRFEAVWLPRVAEAPAFFTRGNGDIVLRSD